MTIRYRNGAYEVVVHVGADPITGKERRVSRTVRMAEQKRTPKEVLDLEAQLRTEVGAGAHGGPKITVAELLTDWLAQARPNLSPLTVRGYERCIDNYLIPHIGAVRLEKLTPARLDRCYADLMDHGGTDGAPLQAKTVRQAHAVLHRALQRALRYRWITFNPASLAEAPKPKKTKLTIPTVEQIRQLIDTAPNPDLALLIALAAATGARRGELCGLRWTDVDLDAGTVLICRAVLELDHQLILADTKTDKDRAVALGPNMIATLRARHVTQARRALAAGVSLAPDGYILSDELDAALPLHPNLASDRFRRHARAQGLHVRLHDLRHAKVSHALQAGIAPNDVAASAGHESTKMTLDVYGHAMAAGVRAMGDILDLGISGAC